MAVAPTTPPVGDLYQVDAPAQWRKGGFCAGFIVIDGKVARWAPILGWAKFRSLGEMRKICEQNGWYLNGPIVREPGDENNLLP